MEPIVAAATDPDLQEPVASYEFFPNLTINVESLLPSNLDFIRYDGSLTTPPCSETVVWSVFLNPVTLSKDQLNAFRRLQNYDKKRIEGNFRPLQQLNGRAEKYYTSLGWSTGVSPIARVQDDLYTALNSFGALIREIVTGIRTTAFLKPTIG
jgi:hypothetical protein